MALTFENLGQTVHMQAMPTQAERLHQQFEEKKVFMCVCVGVGGGGGGGERRMYIRKGFKKKIG
jgi:hypothetical protein